MYCGENIYRTDKASIYHCLKKGIYLGRKEENLEIYKSSSSVDKIYCGNDLLLPQGYIRYGKRSECLRKGFGIGKKLSFNDSLDKLIQDIELLIN